MYKSSSSYAIYATHIAQPTSRSSRVKLMYTRLIEMRRRKFVDRNVNPPSVFAADYDTQNTTRQPTSGFGWVKLMYTRLIEMRRRRYEWPYTKGKCRVIPENRVLGDA
ncbi:hypothetical protein B0H14DRAFT_2621565 [Mycena olivaceomarginata]|nr:hypothetical protein B0H14DRAFT_2621565 [Mycena olivaceomarginata]